MPQGNTPDKQRPNDFYRYSGMAIKMGVVICAGVFGGQKLDENFEMETPVFTIVLSLLSVAVAMYIVVNDTKPNKTE